ncbi:hypothetical protein DXI05_25780 [Salmonella enterica]|nr:hypothetical protein [Salmonella enterica]EGX3982748.1 hypothetical protein [Salmonella enterica]
MPQLALAPASLRRPGFPWTGRCTARVSVSELRAQCRRTNRTSLKRSVTRSKRFFLFCMVSLMVVPNEAAERDSGLLCDTLGRGHYWIC